METQCVAGVALGAAFVRPRVCLSSRAQGQTRSSSGCRVRPQWRPRVQNIGVRKLGLGRGTVWERVAPPAEGDPRVAPLEKF